MNTKPDTKLLHSYWDKSGYIALKKITLEQFKLDEIVASVFSAGPYYFYVVGLHDRSIKFMSPLVQEIHGLNPETATFEDILCCIHPDDMEFVVKAESVVADLMYLKLKNKLDKYKVSYCFRMKTADGSYQLFNHQALSLTFDEEGRVSKSLNIHTNISHLTSENNYKVAAVGLFNEPSFLNIPVDYDVSKAKSVASLFTKREVQIIKLMSEGLTNEKIAQQLCVAINTIKTHRKNILDKSDCKNMAQLMTKCITEGLI